MAGYLGTKAVLLSTTAASVTGNCTVGGNFTVKGGDVTFYEDTGTTPKFFWDASAESLGIGTSSPSEKLHIYESGTGGAFIGIDNTQSGAATTIGKQGSSAYGATAAGEAAFYTYDNSISIMADGGAGNTASIKFSTGGNTERMRIDSSGRFMVGTTTTHGGNINSVTSASTWGMSIFDAVNNQALVRFLNSGSTQVGSIEHNGSSTSYVTSSDYRLKTDAQPMTGASARVQALNPVNFEWISSGERVDGFLAHEAQEVVPEAVTGTKDAMRDEEYEVTPAVLDDDGNVITEAVMGNRSVPDYQGIDQSKLVPLLTAALQEALTKIDDMETRLAALEAV